MLPPDARPPSGTVPFAPSWAARAVELLGAEGGVRWARQAARTASTLAERWQLGELTPLGGGRGGAVWVSGSTRTVLKMPLLHPEIHIAAQRMLWEAGGGVAVRQVDLVNGRTLGEAAAGSVHERAVLDRLSTLRLPGACGLPSLAGWLRSRQLYGSADVAAGSAPVGRARVERALRLVGELDDGTSSFIHGDLGRGNVLVSRGGDVRFIDARGVCGDPAYDVATFIAKTHRRVGPALLRARVRAGAGACGRDPERACGWLEVLQAARV